MKSGFIFIIFMLGTFISGTHPAPTSSDKYNEVKNKKIIFNHISNSQKASKGGSDAHYQEWYDTLKRAIKNIGKKTLENLRKLLKT